MKHSNCLSSVLIQFLVNGYVYNQRLYFSVMNSYILASQVVLLVKNPHVNAGNIRDVPFSWRRAEKHAVSWQLLTAIFTDVSWPSCLCPVLPEPLRQCLEHSRGSRAGPFSSDVTLFQWKAHAWGLSPLWLRLLQNGAADEGSSHPKPLPFLSHFLAIRPTLQNYTAVSLHRLLLPSSCIYPSWASPPMSLLYAEI